MVNPTKTSFFSSVAADAKAAFGRAFSARALLRGGDYGGVPGAVSQTRAGVSALGATIGRLSDTVAKLREQTRADRERAARVSKMFVARVVVEALRNSLVSVVGVFAIALGLGWWNYGGLAMAITFAVPATSMALFVLVPVGVIGSGITQAVASLKAKGHKAC